MVRSSATRLITLAAALCVVASAAPARAQSVGYGEGGYRFALSSAGHAPTSWARPGWDDSGWSRAPRGLGRGSGVGCPLVGDGRWPVDSELLVRHQITLPGQTNVVELGFAFDNDIVAVYWNGVQIHGPSQHEGCATYDSLVVQVPTHLLRRGEDNLLAVRVRDRGVISYYDHRITLR